MKEDKSVKGVDLLKRLIASDDLERIDDQNFKDGNKVWRVSRLILLASKLEPFTLPLKHFNIYNLHPKVETTLEFIKHVKLIINADMDCPIILDEEGYVMDGRHRICRALLEGMETIKAVRFDKTPDYDVLDEKK